MEGVKKNFVYNSLMSVSQLLIPMLTFPYASKVLGVEAMGSVSFADAFCKTFMLISSIGIPIYGVRSVAKSKQDSQSLKKVFQEIFLIHLISTLSLGVFFFALVFVLHKTRESMEFYTLGYIMIVMNVFSFEWYFMGVEKFKELSFRYILIKIFMAVLIFIFVKDRSDSLLYFALTIGMFMGNSILNIFILDKDLFRFGNFFMLDLKHHIRPLFFMFLSNAAITIYMFLDTIILGLICDNTHVGLYATAIKIAKIPLLLVSTLANVLFPKISSLMAQEDKSEALALINKALLLVATFCIPMALGLFAVSNDVVLLFSTSEYAPAILTLKILCFIIPLVGFSNIFGIQVLTSLSKDFYLTVSVTLGMALSVVLNLILAVFLFENGTAIATLSAELSVTLVTYYFATKYLKFHLPTKEILLNIMVCVVFIFISKACNVLFSNYILHLVASVAVCGLYFCVVQIFLLKNPIFASFWELALKKVKSERI